MGLARNLFAARQDRLGIGEGHRGGASFVTLDHTRDHLPDLTFVLIVQSIPLGLANLLNDDLFGRLSADAPDRFLGIQRLTVQAAADRSRLAIDGHLDFLLFAVMLRGGGNQRLLNRLEDDLWIDVLVAVDRVDDPQDFVRFHNCIVLLPLAGHASRDDRRTVAPPAQSPNAQDPAHSAKPLVLS